MTRITRTHDLVEVKIGDLAKTGDIVMVSGNEYQLNEGDAEIHNKYEPDGYSEDSRKRFRLTNKQEQTSREAFEAHTIKKLKLKSPSVDDEFVSHLMARSGDNYKLSVINDKWDDWQAATQRADR